MAAILPTNLDVRIADVLDKRCVGTSTDRSSLGNFVAAGLLRYETNTNEWVYYDGSNWVPFSSLPTRTNIPLNASDMTKVLMEGHLQGGVGDTGALWQQLSLNHLSDVEYISAINMHRTSNGLLVRGNVQTEDANGVSALTLSDSGDIACNDIACNGAVGIGTNTPSAKLQISTGATNAVAVYITNDATSEQGYLFNSSSGTKDLTLQTNSTAGTMGIEFKTENAPKLRIGVNGELGLGATNDQGTDGAVLISKGSGNQVEWRPRVICTAYLPNSVTVTRAAETDMKPMAVEIELGSGSYGYNATTGEYTVPVDGIYSVHYSVGFLDADGASTGAGAMNHARCAIWIDSGSGYAQKYTYTVKNSGLYDDSRLHSSVTAVIDLSQGDKLLCRVGYFAPDSDSVMVGGNGPAFCFQSIHLIG